RSRCRVRRKLRAHRAGHGGRARWSCDRRADEHPVHDAVPRVAALRTERRRTAPASRARGRARARLGRRDHIRCLRDARQGCGLMHTSVIIIELTVLVLAIFVGFEVISKVPTMLHTPLMSGTNAIHGIVLVGAIVVAGLPHQVTWIRVVALAAVALATMNVVGGFVVTDRMLQMFRRREPGPEPPSE